MTISLNLLRELHQRHSLPLSRFGVQALAELRSPLATGVLVADSKGAGRCLRVANPGAFELWLRHQHPGLFGDLGAASPRANNIALRRDSKGGRQVLKHFTVLARAHDLQSPTLASLAETTRTWGAVGILLEIPGSEAAVRGPALPPGCRVMTVENQETFHHSESLSTEADLFLLAGKGGNMRAAFLHWLATQATIQVTHFGDFDPAGLQQFSRILALMPGRASLFVPDGIEALFEQYSNRSLLEKARNRAMLAGLQRGLDPSMDRILDLIARFGPLEQEAALILRTWPQPSIVQPG